MSDSEDDLDIPDRDTCKKLTEDFEKLTGTDVALAQFYLQDRKWDLQRSVNDYFETLDLKNVTVDISDDDEKVKDKEGGSNSQAEDKDDDCQVDEDDDCQVDEDDDCQVDEDEDCQVVEESGGSNSGLKPTAVPPSKLHFITWNLDGLDERNLKRRTRAVVNLIFNQSPDIVFLQELVPDTYQYLKEKLPEYVFLPGGSTDYFVATLLRCYTVYLDSNVVVPFPGSVMGRNMIVTQAHIGTFKMGLVNTHLESTKDHASERISQLKAAFSRARGFPETHTVLLAGDLNLRDPELIQAGGIPSDMMDLWTACGSRQSCRYTWDTKINMNREMAGNFKPRMRFDRVYLRPAHPRKEKPEHFGLVGIDRVPSTQSFPSDHWGLQVFFQINSAVPQPGAAQPSH